ncbi:phage tail tube protein [Rhodococcoides fascians]|uniref:phage tail tube protein n=1 Tax=Rhodococcoides fascians TaxID=1828 RepID=UPI0037995F6F
MAVLKPPNSASLFTFRAAAWAMQINTGTYASPVWAWLRGTSKIEPKTTATKQDDSDNDSDGYGSELVTKQKLDISIEGKVKGERSLSSVVPDPGVTFLRALGTQVGYDNVADIRYWRTDDIDEGYRSYFATEYTDVGGGNEDLQNFQATLSGRGKPTRIARPQTTPINEVQRIRLIGTGLGGTFIAKFLGQATAGLAPTATAAQVLTALTGLSTIGAGNVAVTAVAGLNAWDVAFQGTLAGIDVPLLVLDTSALTGSADKGGEVTTLINGQAAA